VNQFDTGKPERKEISRERVVNFSVAAGSLWIMRHLIFGMILYFVIGQIPGIMVKTDLFRCVCVSLLLSTAFYIVVFCVTALFTLTWCTYCVYRDADGFSKADSPKMDWMKDKRYLLSFFILGIIANAVLLKVFSSFYPNLIFVDGWNAAIAAGFVMVIANRSLNYVQNHVVKLSLTEELNAIKSSF